MVDPPDRTVTGSAHHRRLGVPLNDRLRDSHIPVGPEVRGPLRTIATLAFRDRAS